MDPTDPRQLASGANWTFVVGLDDLIRMKRASARAKDLDDIAALTGPERRR